MELKLKFQPKSIILNDNKEAIAKQNLIQRVWRDVNFSPYELDSAKNYWLNLTMMTTIVPAINKQGKISLPEEISFKAYENQDFAKIHTALSKFIITNDKSHLDILKEYLDTQSLDEINYVFGV